MCRELWVPVTEATAFGVALRALRLPCVMLGASLSLRPAGSETLPAGVMCYTEGGRGAKRRQGLPFSLHCTPSKGRNPHVLHPSGSRTPAGREPNSCWTQGGDLGVRRGQADGCPSPSRLYPLPTSRSPKAPVSRMTTMTRGPRCAAECVLPVRGSPCILDPQTGSVPGSWGLAGSVCV